MSWILNPYQPCHLQVFSLAISSVDRLFRILDNIFGGTKVLHFYKVQFALFFPNGCTSGVTSQLHYQAQGEEDFPL